MKVEFDYIAVRQHGKTFYLANIPAGILTKISYAAVRGKDEEPGAVQRVLNGRRINNIKDFALKNGYFPNSIVINWRDPGNIEIDEENRKLSFEVSARQAQLIDGQHRESGLAEAIKEDEDFSTFDVPVAIYVGLSTKECADIFLSINTEQKPVHRSLVFDLYEIADEQIVDLAAARARDIASELNSEGSAYHGMIKFPGEQARKGGVALSSAVAAIKPLIEANGTFEQVGLSTLENQARVFSNFFDALRKLYGDEWTERQNALIFASGFLGAVEFLEKRLVPYCVQKKSFSTETIMSAIELPPSSLIKQSEVSGKSGTQSVKYIFNRLDEAFVSTETADEYDF